MGEHIEQFKFRNQSVTNLANNILKLRYGEIIKSVYNVDCFKLVDKFKPNAVVRNFGYYCQTPSEYREDYDRDYKSIEERGEPTSFDICKCYSSVLLENKNVIPIYTIHDKIEKYDGGDIVCGEYFVEGVELKVKTYNGRKFMLDNCFRSYLTVRDWLEKGIITKDNIKFMHKSSSGLDSKALSSFVKFVYKTFEFGTAKDLVNKLIGGFGCKYKSKKEGFMTTKFRRRYCYLVRKGEKVTDKRNKRLVLSEILYTELEVK